MQDFSTWFTSFKYEKDEDLWGLALCVEILLPSAEILCFRDFFFFLVVLLRCQLWWLIPNQEKNRSENRHSPKTYFLPWKWDIFFHAPSVSWNIYVPDPIAQWVKNQIKMSQIRIFFLLWKGRLFFWIFDRCEITEFQISFGAKSYESVMCKSNTYFLAWNVSISIVSRKM